jgi:hypothetical protein
MGKGKGREEVGRGKWDVLDSALAGATSLKPIKMTLYKCFYEVSCVYGYFILLFTSKSPLSCYRCTCGAQNNTISPILVSMLDLSFKSSCVLSLV